MAGICAVWLLFSYIGIGTIFGLVGGLLDRPVDTSLTREAYIERCDEVSAEQYYRAYAEYEDKFVKTELVIVSKSQFSGSSPYSEDIFYICRPINDGDYYIIVRDCQVDSDRIYLAGDKLIIYGQGDDFTYAFAPDDTRIEGPCLNMAYAELTE